MRMRVIATVYWVGDVT